MIVSHVRDKTFRLLLLVPKLNKIRRKTEADIEGGQLIVRSRTLSFID